MMVLVVGAVECRQGSWCGVLSLIYVDILYICTAVQSRIDIGVSMDAVIEADVRVKVVPIYACAWSW